MTRTHIIKPGETKESVASTVCENVRRDANLDPRDTVICTPKVDTTARRALDENDDSVIDIDIRIM